MTRKSRAGLLVLRISAAGNEAEKLKKSGRSGMLQGKEPAGEAP